MYDESFEVKILPNYKTQEEELYLNNTPFATITNEYIAKDVINYFSTYEREDLEDEISDLTNEVEDLKDKNDSLEDENDELQKINDKIKILIEKFRTFDNNDKDEYEELVKNIWELVQW